ncbi:hypothetical protein H5410_060198 [Solanum commersonii]|uniref:NB-ARC domain-containing protein n=1 Tax=Solanum commersonii TaxID=4109 RepID=A0A9J5W5B7_SOLCO|nr:hypothetical protein H5410_060198 [Solanum commersonii]
MEFLSIFVDKVTDCLIQPVARGIGYLFYYKSNIRSMEDESKKLEDIRIGVHQRVEDDQRNLRVISPNVEARFTSIDTTTAEVAVSHYSLSRRAKKIELELIELRNDGNAYAVFSYPIVEIEVIPRNSGEEFDSRKLQEEEVMAALKDGRVAVIGICGMGGVDPKRIQGEIARGVGLTLDGDDMSSHGDCLRTSLMGQNSCILIILDDVWKALDLKRLGIPCGSNHNHRCKVTFTTHFRSICEAMEAQKIMEVGTLSEEEAWILFRQKIGALKKHKNKRSWDCALEELRSAVTISIPEVPTELYKPLKLSYDYLQSNEAKHLFLLCSLFEEDSDICPDELLRYGMGLHIFPGIKILEHARNKGKHIFMVSHDVNSEEFPRKDSYEQYTHMSIVANNFDELPSPISFPKLKLLMLKLCFEVSFKLQDDFFDGMSELHVLSLRRVGYTKPILPFPESIKRLSSLRMMCPSELRLDDISIIGELVTLEILSIRDSELEELPVEIGKLTNLIVLEFWNVYITLKRISAGVLSRLVRLEELHLVGVEDCSYSTLSDLESLSILTVLTLSYCSGDVIYSNLVLPSKLTGYSLKVGANSSMDYDKNIVLEVTETTPLGDWICHLLKESESVCSTGKGSNNVLTELQQNKFQNVKSLSLFGCDLVTHLLNISGWTHEVIKFPNLYELELVYLECLTHFCSDYVEGIEFPRLRKMSFNRIPEFQNFWPTANNYITHSNPHFHEKVSCPNLEKLCIDGANNISALCSHQLQTPYFSKLVKLEVYNCGKLRNMMPPSVTKGLLNLRELEINNCQSMEEVITKGEGIMTLFPLLEQLKLEGLPKLGHFFLTKHALQIPFLRKVKLYDCLEMKTFVQEGISMNLESVNNDDEVKVVDLNKDIFNSKQTCKIGSTELWKIEKLDASISGQRCFESTNTKDRWLSINEKSDQRREQQGEGIMTLFPLLEQLELEGLPKLGYFFLTEHALQIPFLRKVKIYGCLEMKTFVQQGIFVSHDSDDEVKVMFNSKVFCPNLEELYISGANILNVLCSYQLSTAYFSKLGKLQVRNCGNLRNLMSQSGASGLLNLRELEIKYCQSMEEVITEEEQQGEGNMTLFPLLEKLLLWDLPKLGHFFLMRHPLKFPFLREVRIYNCPEMKTFVEQRPMSTPSLESMNNENEVKLDDLNKPMFNSKVSCPSLKELYINGANNTSALCSHLLPTDNLSKLEILYIRHCGKLRNLMSQSMARGALNLQILDITDRQSMEKVIREEEQQGEKIMTLFPLLEKLTLQRLPNLGHFFLTECTLEIPFLKVVDIDGCPKMKTFVLQGISVSLESDDEVNKVMFNSKVFCPNLEELYISGANILNGLCSYQLPIAYFSKLEKLQVRCGKLRNLMPQSVARDLLSLRELEIIDCQSIEELWDLPKLGHFFLIEHALEFPFLEEVLIYKCPEMKTFVQRGISVSTPSLESVNFDYAVQVDDLNKWTQQRFTSQRLRERRGAMYDLSKIKWDGLTIVGAQEMGREIGGNGLGGEQKRC